MRRSVRSSTFKFRLEPALKTRVDAAADLAELPVSAWVREACIEKLERDQSAPTPKARK